MVVSETASQLLQAAQKALDSYFYPTAEFLAERVLAADATNEKAVLLLAESYSRQGKWNKVPPLIAFMLTFTPIGVAV